MSFYQVLLCLSLFAEKGIFVRGIICAAMKDWTQMIASIKIIKKFGKGS
ncbi:hypothetical protein [Phascolarctobacterium faecium]|nr:hypothetical protein [Phascolarctobacterium faecium]